MLRCQGAATEFQHVQGLWSTDKSPQSTALMKALGHARALEDLMMSAWDLGLGNEVKQTGGLTSQGLSSPSAVHTCETGTRKSTEIDRVVRWPSPSLLRVSGPGV